MTHTGGPKPPRRWLPILLFLLPVWLIASAGIGLWLYFHNQRKDQGLLEQSFSRMVSAASLADDVHKLTRVIGERHGQSDPAGAALDQAARMIEGALGPSNTGLEIQTLAGPARWPILTTRIPGSKPGEPALWVLTSYDSRPASSGVEANATGLASVLAAAQALVATPPERSIHFAFIPHANDPDSPVLDTLARFANHAGDPHLILCVEAMGAGDTLWLTARDTDSPAFQYLAGLGEAKGAEVTCLHDDTDVASILFETGAPSVRIATRAQIAAGEADDREPDPATLAASTGRLVTYIQRIAGSKAN